MNISERNPSGSHLPEGTILFVDDEQINLAVGERVLERLGYKVLTASNGIEAIDNYRLQSADIILIIMDLNMPVMNGEEAIREIRSFDPEARFIVSSGVFTKSQIRDLDLLGIRSFLKKPYHADAVRSAIEDVLSGNICSRH